MATVTNASQHPLILSNLTIQPGEVIEGFDDKAAEAMKDDLFVKAEWLVIKFDKPTKAQDKK